MGGSQGPIQTSVVYVLDVFEAVCPVSIVKNTQCDRQSNHSGALVFVPSRRCRAGIKKGGGYASLLPMRDRSVQHKESISASGSDTGINRYGEGPAITLVP